MIDVLQKTFTPSILLFLLKGIGITVAISVVVVLLSVVFGTLLGLLRSYSPLVPRKLSGAYIELFRNTPNLLWVTLCAVFMPLPSLFLRACSSMVLFTSAVIAEIVRGGLNAIPKGQFEAAKAQGFSFVQSLRYIILPQCFRSIVPTLMSQVTTAIKDTSFLAIVAVPELMYKTKQIMSLLPRLTGQTLTLTHVLLLMGFAALVYFLINFTLSCVVRGLQKRRTA